MKSHVQNLPVGFKVLTAFIMHSVGSGAKSCASLQKFANVSKYHIVSIFRDEE
jgi:hypothetical protein